MRVKRQVRVHPGTSRRHWRLGPQQPSEGQPARGDVRRQVPAGASEAQPLRGAPRACRCSSRPAPAIPDLAFAEQTLAALDEHSGTGPDLLPSRVLKRCTKSLAQPLRALAVRILATGQWPDGWREHWVAPIYKRKAVFRGENYRGVHLTAQLSKAMERFLAPMFAPHLAAHAFGSNQFAHTKERRAETRWHTWS